MSWNTILEPPSDDQIPSSWERILQEPLRFYTTSLRKQSTTTAKCILNNRTRKRRRKRIKDNLSNVSIPPVVGSTSRTWCIPETLKDCPQNIVNAITTVLPLQANIFIFGHKIPIRLLGVLYRHKKLTWVIENPQNHTQYLSCHFLADLTHLCETMRNQLKDKITLKKYNRQSFNSATYIYATDLDYQHNRNKIALTTLGSSILQFNPSSYDFNKILQFLRGTDHPQNILRIKKKKMRKVIFTKTYEESCRGWKTFAPTTNNSGTCSGGKRRRCTCHNIARSITAHPNWTINDIVSKVPTTIPQLVNR